MDDSNAPKDGGLIPKVDEKRNSVGRPKGLPKTGGRQKGSLNKRSIWLSESLDSAGFNFGDEFKKLYEQANLEQKIFLLSHVLPYLAPKIKEKELDTAIDVPSSVTSTAELMKLAKG